MRSPKIVLIGAASVIFGPTTIRDLLLSPALQGSEIVLVDIAGEGLEPVLHFAERLNEVLGRECRISATADRRQALPGADFVVVSVAVDRERTWKLDFEIPLRHGVRHVLGENGGPGGLSHSLRNIPLLLDIARDIEALAPRAWVINFTNPMSRLCSALARHTRLRFVGLCHQSLAIAIVDVPAGGDQICHTQSISPAQFRQDQGFVPLDAPLPVLKAEVHGRVPLNISYQHAVQHHPIRSLGGVCLGQRRKDLCVDAAQGRLSSHVPIVRFEVFCRDGILA